MRMRVTWAFVGMFWVEPEECAVRRLFVGVKCRNTVFRGYLLNKRDRPSAVRERNRRSNKVLQGPKLGHLYLASIHYFVCYWFLSTMVWLTDESSTVCSSVNSECPKSISSTPGVESKVPPSSDPGHRSLQISPSAIFILLAFSGMLCGIDSWTLGVDGNLHTDDFPPLPSRGSSIGILYGSENLSQSRNRSWNDSCNQLGFPRG